MRSISLLTLAAFSITLFSACSAISTAQRETRYRMSDCSSQEGYPDCQDGFRVVSNPVTAGGLLFLFETGDYGIEAQLLDLRAKILTINLVVADAIDLVR